MSLDVSSSRFPHDDHHPARDMNATASTSSHQDASGSTSNTQPVQEWDHPLSQDAQARSDADGQHPTEAEEAKSRTSQIPDEEYPRTTVPPTQTVAPATELPAAQVDGTSADPLSDRGENEALSVRRHMIGSAWDGFTLLTRFRRWIFVLRLLIALTQIAVGIAIMALPSSLGNSPSYPETCDPEGMFVYLVLHCLRVACSIPVDAYLGLSPHRSPRARRRGAEGLMERERERRIGSLHLDRKMGRFGDLLGFCHVVLFIVGNYVVWTSVECSRTPADSRPLFFTCVAMLSITYLLIFEVALMVFLVVFFLPVLIAILSALGLSHRLPQRDIHPETGKVNQDDIEKHSKLVYYTPAESGDGTAIAQGPIGTEHEAVESENVTESRGDHLPDEAAATINSAQPTLTIGAPSSSMTLQQTEDVPQQLPKRRRIGRLFGLSRQHASSASLKNIHGRGATVETGEDAAPTKYPLHQIPAHRATCPICLCDYEEVTTVAAPATDASTQEAQPTSDSSDQVVLPTSSLPEPEPLRLLSCGHVMHKSCVDQWLTAVSGRCPVCQRPIMSASASSRGGDEA